LHGQHGGPSDVGWVDSGIVSRRRGPGKRQSNRLARSPTVRVKSHRTPSRPGRPVPINAVCPECKTRFRLQDAMVGKLIRCATCQEMFTVFDAGADAAPPPAPPTAVDKPQPADATSRTRVDPAAVVSRSGNVSDFVQVIRDVAPAQPPRPAPAPT